MIVGACGDYHSFLRDSPVALGGGELELAGEYERWLREREPVRHPETVARAALLLVNGGRDHVIPKQCADRTMAAFREAFEASGDGSRFRQVWIPDATHNDLVERAKAEIVAWWERWLLQPPRGRR